MRVPFIAIAAVALAGFAGEAQAQDVTHASQRLEFHGDAPAGCVASSARASKLSNATFQDGGATGGVVTFTSFVDETTAATRGSTVELTLPVVCNTSHLITVRSTNRAMLREGANAARSGSGGFGDFQNYDVNLQWQQSTATLASQDETTSISYGQPAKGDLIVDIAIPRGSQPLVAGTYTDAVVVEIRPNN